MVRPLPVFRAGRDRTTHQPREVEGRSDMEIVGIVATAVVAVIVVGAAYVGVRSIPDLRRYLKIRHM
ncbi:DUF6893 family small protein [Nocardia sp. NBC_01499]|uniref:DUF6893 family small protein n=1 Tax=Nocardia sp. NBC_01499 TaxID=2903597 RepID=UPI00386E163E